MIKLYMYAGSIGAGKAYEMLKHVKFLKETGFSVAMLSLADPIKTFVSDIFGVNKYGEFVDTPSTKIKTHEELVKCFCHYFKSHIEEFDYNETISQVITHKTIHLKTAIEEAIENLPDINAIRFLYQIIGTDIAHTFDRRFWLFLLEDKIDVIKDKIDFVFVDDLRFLFEFLFLRESYSNQFDVEPYYINAPEEVRAKRRNITLEELRTQSEHISERESLLVIKPYVSLYYSGNLINNGANQ